MRSFEADLDSSSLRVAIAASRFNDEIVSGLIEGAVDCLRSHGSSEESISLFRVPGAFELPVLTRKLLLQEQYDAVIALGALVRGETPHFDFISIQVTLDLSRVALEAGKPVAFGVITCNDMDQARHRIAPGSNKGWEAALAAIEMSNLFRLVDRALDPHREG